MFNLITPVSYWILVVLWLVILVLYITRLRQSKIVGGAIAVLLSILAIDAFRTVFESVYFGLYFNSLFGLLPKGIHEVLSEPGLIIIPKLVNVVAGVLVLFLLVRRWIPQEIHEREEWINSLRESESRYRKIFNNAEVSIWNEDLSEVYKTLDQLRSKGVTDLRQYIKDEPQFTWNMAAKVRVTHVNEATLKLFGAKAEDELLYQIDKTFGANTIEVFIEELCAIWEGSRGFHSEANFKSFDGRDISAIVSFNIPDTAEGFKSIPVTIIDITDRKQAEAELQKLSRAVEASSSSIMITDCDGNIEYVNPKFVETTGYTEEEVMGKNPRLLKSGEAPEEIYSDLWETILAGKEWKGELHNQKADGSLFWIRSSISGVKNAEGKLTHFIGIQDDVTHEYELNEQLNFQASHDALTGLINRREFERRAERLLATIKQNKTEHALCYLDLDQFKIVNDTCGHTAGDELLRQLGQVLQGVVRQRDTLARLGGDEFGVLMEHCTLEQAHRTAEALKEAVWNFQFIWEEQSFRVGVSIGLVAITETTPNLTELLKEADAACYMAKDLGRNRIHVYETEDANLAQRHGEMQWVTRLQHALDENRFCLYAQSIVPLDGRSDKHYELLIRKVNEQGTVIPPGAFLPSAERYNLMEQLDCWVIKKALTLLSTHPAFLAQINFISINLSGRSLTENRVLDFIVAKLDESGIDGEKVCFEITETAAISNLSSAIRFISTLRGLGCRFALDDFGSGLSSFGYLKNLPVDYLKIDGLFVKDIVDDPIDYAMVKSINEIGHVMGMQTIAEFVENDAIKGMLREIGVDYAQGYGIDKPISMDEVLNNYKND